MLYSPIKLEFHSNKFKTPYTTSLRSISSLLRCRFCYFGELISEPTTDKFTVVIHGQEDRPVEGNSLAVVKELPYEGLSRFGPG